MNETIKTVIFVAVAVLVVAAVWATRPTVDTTGGGGEVGQPLFPDFTDPLAATSMEIVKYDEQTSDKKTFKVAQVDGIWSIPSHDNYPADAKNQLAEAATSVMGLNILALISENLGDQEEFGVVDPADKDLKPGSTGVGIRVTMRDKDDKLLLALVVGRRDEEQAQNRYVRRVGQDQIYSVKVDTDKLTTKFADWIEPDLLNLSPWDIRQMDIQDYSVDEANRSVIQRGEIWLDYDDAAEKDKWKLTADRKFVDGKWVAEQLPPGMELNTKMLDEMKSALDDLKIVDVARKPVELAKSLKENKEFLNSPESVESLMSRGFYLADVKGKPGIYSNEGEFRCLMKDGVEYILRFGNISESRRADIEEGKDGKKKAGGINRYIFVMAEFNPTAILRPRLAEKPGEVEISKGDKDAKKPGEVEISEGDKDAKKPGEVEISEGDKGDKDDKDEEKSAEKKTADAKIKAQWEKIETENQRKLDEYEEKVAEAKTKVNELNARFADWYYVIPNSVYEKIRLGRKDIIVKKKPAEKKDAPTDALPDDTLPDGALPDGALPDDTLPDVGGIPRRHSSGHAGTVEEKPAR